MNCTHVCETQTTDLFFTKLEIVPDFPSLADETAEPSPDMNVKVAAFTVSEKSIKTNMRNWYLGLVNINACIKFGEILSICSQEIESKWNTDVDQGQ